MAAEPVPTDRPPQRRQLHAVPDPTDEVMPPWPPIPDDLDATVEKPAADEQVTPAQAGLIVRMLAAARSDLSAWWLVAVRPKSLAELITDLKPDLARVPDGSRRLRALWILDNYLTGLACAAAGIVLGLGAGAFFWFAGHPARRWAAIVLIAVTIAVLLATR